MGYTLNWTETQQGLALTGSLVQSATDSTNLVLAAEELYVALLRLLPTAHPLFAVEREEYRFRLQATRDWDGATGFAEVALVFNSPPFGGSFEVLAEANNSDSYTLSAFGWLDSNPPLSYRFFFTSSSSSSGAAGREQALTFAGSRPESNVVLPPGVLTLSVVVTDEVRQIFGVHTRPC